MNLAVWLRAKMSCILGKLEEKEATQTEAQPVDRRFREDKLQMVWRKGR